MDRGAWRATAHGVAKSPTHLSVHVRARAHTCTHARTHACQVDKVWPQDVDWVQVWSILSHLPGNKGLPSGSAGKVSACNAGDQGSIPGLGRSPGEGNGNPLQYSFLENPMDRGVWWAIVMGSQDLDMI